MMVRYQSSKRELKLSTFSFNTHIHTPGLKYLGCILEPVLTQLVEKSCGQEIPGDAATALDGHTTQSVCLTRLILAKNR